MSYKAEVVEVVMQKHDNADSLSIVKVFDGYTVVVRTEDWLKVPLNNKGQRLAVFVPPDTIVDSKRPEFSFLQGGERIRAKKLRGVISFGLLVPAPEGAEVGDDYWDKLGLVHYQPGISQKEKDNYLGGGEVESGPDVYAPKYDLESFHKYGRRCFSAVERVFVHEKLDGSNCRFVYHNGKMYCGSRTEWKREYANYEHITKEFLMSKGQTEDKAEATLEGLSKKSKAQNGWWRLLRENPCIEEFCKANHNVVLYGEMFGNTNCIKYGFDGPQNRFAAFDLLKSGVWMDWPEALDLLNKFGVPVAPDVFGGPIEFDFNKILEATDGNTLVTGAKDGVIREGVVVRAIKECSSDRIGRHVLKSVSGVFLEKYK